MSDIRFNQWLHQSGTGGVSQDHIGNIGIGTTNPSIVVSAANTAVLNVGVITANNLFVNNAFNGDITGNVTGNISGATGTFSGNVDIADKIIHTGDTDTAMRFPADNTFAVDTAGSERLRITSDGNIGIGNTNPGDFRAGAENLVVGSGSGAEGMTIYSATNASGRICFADGSGASDEERGVIQYAHDDNHMQFDTNATERLRINSLGNIGMSNDMTGAGGVYARLTVQMPTQSGGSGIQVANSSNGSGDGTTSNIVLRSVNNDCSQWAGAEYRASDHIFAIQGTEKLRINSDGRLLINATNNPTLGGQTPYLRVNGGYTNLDGLRIRGLDTGNTIWKDGGDMGITVSSAHSLYLKTNSATGLQVTANGQVATPLQPRFHARRSSTYTGYNGQNIGSTWIAYNVEDYDIGGNFATSGADQGRFIAPVSGLYLFHAAAYKGTGTADWTQSWFDVDGSRESGTDFVHSSTTRFAQNAIQIYLLAGQKVGYHPYNNQNNNEIISTGNHTWFKGCLLG